MPEIRVFNKPPKSYQALIEKLADRNLTINDHDLAMGHLRNIGYYRLVGYGLPFELRNEDGSRQGIYKPDTSFDTLLNVYITDRKIRILLLSAIERIEVAIRNIINHELACKYQSAHWYLDASIFKESDDFSHRDFLKQIRLHTLKNEEADSDKEGKIEVFIHHYYRQYDEPEYPPCWMVAEILSLGAWSKVYENLSVSRDRKIISRQLSLPPATLQSWLHSLTYLRNMCAHHSRLFGRKFVMRPNQISNTPFVQENRLFNYICVVFRLLKTISPNSDWLDEFHDQLEPLSEDLLQQYGFDINWLEHSFWLD